MTTECRNPAALNRADQKSTALDMILGAWDQALAKGCAPETIATSAIFAALADLIDVYGEDVVAEMTKRLPERVNRGEFSMREGPLN
ncbi:hypothetical protein MNBD_ALPHA06-1040 [hydrothermal vent metagenome]|uniref:Uncharacterized protein n=1 Tax=hydrothermal vent metagenome TaxID=652676 RepID=A0A3B0RVQ3_9ZZZZ